MTRRDWFLMGVVWCAAATVGAVAGILLVGEKITRPHRPHP